MKNKLLLLILLVFSTFSFSQTSQELDKAMLSKDPKVIAEFIKKYPNNKNTPFLQRKLNSMTGSGNAAAKPSIQRYEISCKLKIGFLRYISKNN